jgi:hypothetical protein
MLEHGRAVARQMLNEPDGAPLGSADQLSEPPLALDQRQVAQVVAVLLDQVERELGSSWVICWLVSGSRPYPDFAPRFAARLASSRNVFAIAACFVAFSGSGFCFARSSRRLDISMC